MSIASAPGFYLDLVNELRKLPRETEWLEFKHNNEDPHEIGEYISALANSAAIAGKAKAYLVWGVDDTTHDIVGTSFEGATARKGAEELESWLLRQLSPKIHFRFIPLDCDGRRLVVLEMERAAKHTVRFAGVAYIRVGSYKKLLKDYPEKERELWRALDATCFEEGLAAEKLGSDEVTVLLDYSAYFSLLGLPLPPTREGVLEALAGDRIVMDAGAGRWNVTNLGAIMLARRLADFGRLGRKSLRIVQYRGKGRLEALRERDSGRGYALDFADALSTINDFLPANEVIVKALRTDVPMFPPLALRELVANALIHQDFFVTGAGPMVELFDDRVEITNPGEPLVDTDRFIDTPPTSRNDTLASLARRFRFCEERGSGVDKAVAQIELYQLPAPLFEVPTGFTRVSLFAPMPLSEMSKADRIRACYLHACLKYVTSSYLTNSTLRGRFGIEERNSAIASRIIKETLEAGLIVPLEPDTSRKLMKYAPWWIRPRDATVRGQ